MALGRGRDLLVGDENLPPGQPLGLVDRVDPLELEDVVAFIRDQGLDPVFLRSVPPV
jgi:hypothetical protein